MQLEADRAKTQQFLDTAGLFPGIRMELDDKSIAALKPKIEQVQILTSRIDSQRQKLVSLELLMLDNSIKELHSVTGQVDGSVKALQSTTRQVNDSVKSLHDTTTKVVKSSTRIEYLTILVALTTVSSIAITLMTINIYYSVAVSIGGLIALVRLWQKISKHPAFKSDEAENK
jgi:hypothetical protein